jgi:CRISPR-associated protein Csb1
VKDALRPSELNHGNIVFDNSNGGIRCRFAEQTTVVSLGALRKLRFPQEGKNEPARDTAAPTVLAAIALCAGVLSTERGLSLRSRCHLVPIEPRVWELLDQPGSEPVTFTITGAAAIHLLNEAIGAAKSAGVSWMEEKLTLTPAPELIELVKRSQEVAATENESEG